MKSKIEIRALTPEGLELSIAILDEPVAAALVHKLGFEKGDELFAIQAQRIQNEPLRLVA